MPLTATLCYVDAVLGARPLHACARLACACAGVFYKDLGGGQLQVQVTMPGAARFGNRPPLMELVTQGRGEAVTVSTAPLFGSCKWVAGVRAWVVTFRPDSITGEGALACVRATVGRRVARTPGFEVRTKPSEWLALHGVDTPAAARAFAAKCAPQLVPTDVVLRERTAFVRFANRSAAYRCLEGWRTQLRRKSAELPLTDGERGVLVSMLPSLNSLYKDDPRLRAVPLTTRTADAATEDTETEDEGGDDSSDVDAESALPPPPLVVLPVVLPAECRQRRQAAKRPAADAWCTDTALPELGLVLDARAWAECFAEFPKI
jgi:hypothetical protein